MSVRVFGNRYNNEIFKYLVRHPNSLLADIVSGTGFVKSTTEQHVASMLDMGVILADLAPGKRRGRALTYSTNEPMVRELFRAHVEFLFDVSDEDDNVPGDAPEA